MVVILVLAVIIIGAMNSWSGNHGWAALNLISAFVLICTLEKRT